MIADLRVNGKRTSEARSKNVAWFTFKLSVPLLISLVFYGETQTSHALTLAWSSSTGSGVSGYRVYQGGASRTYTNILQLGNVTNATVSGLTTGSTYYFAVTAYAANGLESGYSTEVAYTLPTSPTIALYSPVNGSTYTAPANMALGATVAANGHAITKVQFFNGATLISEDTVAPYTLTWSNVPAGSYTLTAKAIYDTGSSVTSAPVTVTCSAPPVSIVLTAPASGSSYSAPANINLAASVTANGHTINKVQFYAGSTLLVEDTVSPYTYFWKKVPAGSYVLTAKAVYDNGSVASSAAASVTVGPVNVAVAGLVAAYGFEEGTGTTVMDTSGKGNNGTLSGASWATGKYGKGLSFNGTNAMVTINSSASVQLTNGMTLEAWVKPSNVSSRWRDVIFKGDDNYYLEATSTSGGVPGTGGTFCSLPSLYGTARLTTNAWAHLAATYDGAMLQLYVNGQVVSSIAQTGSIAVSSNPLQIGGDTFYGQYFQGVIDEVRVYNRALSASEIVTDMSSPVVSGTASSLLVAANLVAPSNDLPPPWESIDLDPNVLPGTDSVTDNVCLVSGAGTLGDLSDTSHFLYQPMSNNGEISALLGSSGSTNPDARAGVMIRETLNSDSRYAFLGVSPDGMLHIQTRTGTGTSSADQIIDPGGNSPLWVRLVRAADNFLSYGSLDGSTWVSLGTNEVPMANNIYMGFNIGSGDPTALNTCTFSNTFVLP